MKNIALLTIILISFEVFAGIGGSVGGGGRSSSEIPWGKRLETLADFDQSLTHIVQWPNVVFSNQSVPVKNVCTKGSNLKTINPVSFCAQQVPTQICTHYGKGTEENCRDLSPGETPNEGFNTRLVWGCAQTKSEIFETPKTYQAPVCAQWEQVSSSGSHGLVWTCVSYGQELKEYPEHFEVSVLSTQNSGHKSPEEVAKINYDLPACSE